MGANVTPIDATLGAVVTGLTLARMDAATWKAVEEAFHAHAVLVFPGQNLTEAEQVAFANRFGDIELLAADPKQKAVAISNQKPDGSVMTVDEHRFKSLRGNEGWHTDSSYMPLSAKASVLSAQVVPSTDGETEWADMRAAYDALDEATRRRIAGLSAHHSLYHSQAKIGHVVETGTGYGFHAKGAPLRSLVKVHPVTGRPALYIGRHAYGIPGLAPAESEHSCPTSSTSHAGRRERTRTGGSPATWSSGTTAVCCTARGPMTTARCAPCGTRAWPAIRPPGLTHPSRRSRQRVRALDLQSVGASHRSAAVGATNRHCQE